ncbi:hypothetical protein EOM81_11435 [bacterium]|nr:hypothetical protein [bacterium]
MDRKIAKAFSNIKDIARAFENLFLYRSCTTGRLAEILEDSKLYLKPLDPKIFAEIYSLKESLRIGEGKAIGDVSVLIKKLYQSWFSQIKNYCLQMEGKLLPVKDFNQGIAGVLNLADLMKMSHVERQSFVDVVRQVLNLYPDYGYEKDKDEAFVQKCGSLGLNMQSDLLSKLAAEMTIKAENAALPREKRRFTN